MASEEGIKAMSSPGGFYIDLSKRPEERMKRHNEDNGCEGFVILLEARDADEAQRGETAAINLAIRHPNLNVREGIRNGGGVGGW